MKKNRDKEIFIVKKRIGVILFLRDFLLTMALWALWIYLLYPLIALVLWKLDIDIFFYYDSVSQINALEASLKEFLVFSSIIVFCIVCTVLGWGYYNQRKYAFFKNQRRTFPKPISSKMIAASLSIKPKIIDTAKEARYVQFYHTDKSPQDISTIFKPFQKANITHVNIVFNDNWNKVRENSNFSYTHLQQEDIQKSFYLQKK